MAAHPATIRHLARRFFGHLRARPLAPAEQDTVAAALPEALAELFFRQSPADQRHALAVADRVRRARPDDDAAFVAALLHDVGKVEADVGPIARSIATIMDALRLPLPHSWRRYRRHGEIGAHMLAAAGAPPVAVAFARHHPGPVPDGVDEETWRALGAADHV